MRIVGKEHREECVGKGIEERKKMQRENAREKKRKQQTSARTQMRKRHQCWNEHTSQETQHTFFALNVACCVSRFHSAKSSSLPPTATNGCEAHLRMRLASCPTANSTKGEDWESDDESVEEDEEEVEDEGFRGVSLSDPASVHVITVLREKRESICGRRETRRKNTEIEKTEKTKRGNMEEIEM